MGDRSVTGKAAASQDEALLVDYGAGDDGHRAQYKAMLAKLFHLRLANFSPAMLVARAPVLCPQIEAAPLRFVLTCLIRSLLGRRTVGFLLRPLPALRGQSLRLRLKRIALKLLRRTPSVQVLTIVPFAIEPEFDAIAHGWIHDLQNWDLQLESAAAETPAAQALARGIRGHAQGRPVCCAVGRQVRDKGFDRFTAIYEANPALRDAVLFAFGGRVPPELAVMAGDFADHGGFVLDRFISDDELAGLYAAADLIWCVYSPEYDQASGVLGRALQFGIPVIARRGSVIAAICANEGHPCIELGAADDWQAVVALPQRAEPGLARNRARQHGEVSLARLAEALGIAPAWDPFADSVA
jgi:hypothetical protein